MSHLLFRLKQRLYSRLLDSIAKHHCKRCRKPTITYGVPINDQGGLTITYRWQKEFPDTATHSDWTILPEDY